MQHLCTLIGWIPSSLMGRPFHQWTFCRQKWWWSGTVRGRWTSSSMNTWSSQEPAIGTKPTASQPCFFWNIMVLTTIGMLSMMMLSVGTKQLPKYLMHIQSLLPSPSRTLRALQSSFQPEWSSKSRWSSKNIELGSPLKAMWIVFLSVWLKFLHAL